MYKAKTKENVLNAVKNGSTVAAASRQYNVNYGTAIYWVNSQKATTKARKGTITTASTPDYQVSVDQFISELATDANSNRQRLFSLIGKLVLEKNGITF